MKQDALMVLEDVQFDAIKTKEFVGLVNALSLNNQKILLILGEKTDSVYLASRNLKKVKVVTADSFNTYDVLNARKVLVTQTAVSRIEEILN
jgi:large subunit ribosomal protein L4